MTEFTSWDLLTLELEFLFPAEVYISHLACIYYERNWGLVENSVNFLSLPLPITEKHSCNNFYQQMPSLLNTESSPETFYIFCQ